MISLCPVFLAPQVHGTTATLTTLFGVLKDTGGGSPIPDGALWIMVYDQNNDGVFPGGLATDGTLSDAVAARDAFGGLTLAKGDLIEGDRVIHLDSSNSVGGGSPGTPQNLFFLDLTGDNLTPGRKWAIYWFPSLTTGSTTVPPGDFEVGGMNEITEIQDFSDGPMVIPNGGLSTIAAYDTSLAGTLPPSRFHAITAAAADDYAAWIDGYFPGETDPAKVGFTADPDHDGLENGVEAILASSPDVPTPGLSLVSAGAGSVVCSSHLSKSLPSDVAAVWQWSINLSDWHLSGESQGPLTVTISHLVTDSSPPGHDVLETTAAGSGGPLTGLFCRLVAVQSP